MLHNCSDQTIEESGFSTLEAVIAVGILALCVLPLMDFQKTVSEGALKLSQINENIAATEQAENYLRHLPAEEISGGSANLGNLSLSWRQVGGAHTGPALSEAGAPGRFNIALIALDYQIAANGQPIGGGRLERVVWQATSPFLDQEFGSDS